MLCHQAHAVQRTNDDVHERTICWSSRGEKRFHVAPGTWRRNFHQELKAHFAERSGAFEVLSFAGKVLQQQSHCILAAGPFTVVPQRTAGLWRNVKDGGCGKKIRQERTSLQAGSPCAGSPETNGEPASRLSRKKKKPGNYVSITLIIVSSNTYQIIQENWDTVTDKGIDSNFNPRQAPLAINESDARWTFRSLPTGSLFGKAMARAENWGEL